MLQHRARVDANPPPPSAPSLRPFSLPQVEVALDVFKVRWVSSGATSKGKWWHGVAHNWPVLPAINHNAINFRITARVVPWLLAALPRLIPDGK
ncbi:cell division control protein 42 [Anopheles sinensis]|uniref:Cell division control protein 42 n=1 Tax=Anopheles sinensis TaxID=74873 RepID=A0A084VG62_ANOSI|nr:cell division control protein 42 [Anopheles sinensis]